MHIRSVVLIRIQTVKITRFIIYIRLGLLDRLMLKSKPLILLGPERMVKSNGSTV